MEIHESPPDISRIANSKLQSCNPCNKTGHDEMDVTKIMVFHYSPRKKNNNK